MFSLNSSNKSRSSSSSNSDFSNDTKKAITHLFLHPFLPYDKKDDENFKILLCKNQLKNKLISKYKTDSSSIIDYYINNRLDNVISLQKAFSLQKIRKNKYLKHLCFVYSKKFINFKVFSDKEIGINPSYNCILKEYEFDNDEETDEEELKLGTEKAMKVISESVKIKKPFSFVNKKIKIIRRRKTRKR